MTLTIFPIFAILPLSTAFAGTDGFTQKDRERLIRLETTLRIFMEQTNKRFEELREDMNKRFEAVDKRFEDMNKRFEELQEDMNRRFEAVDKRFEDMNRRFEDINKRFEDMNKRFEEQIKLFKWIAGIMAGMVAAFVGLLIWDRRTAVSSAVKESERNLENKFKLHDFPKLLKALRELAKEDDRLAKVLRNFNLL